ncbi:hypothetical protein [uncultured Pantoea sp.]|uniref:hypothetical protein n=1 Tax=uncultured Pantoea sp. TaxID=218084 RepID=UPI0025829151|nr:hypothetical protein [uncultured Pantoea sp.]
MEFSFSKGSAIERLAYYPQIEIKELARALANLDPHTRNDELPEDKISIVSAYSDYLVRVHRYLFSFLKSQGKTKELDVFYPKLIATNCPIESGILFASCFKLIEEGITPKIIIEKCIESLVSIYKKHGESIIFQCAGTEGVLVAKDKSQDRRGFHKKDEESASLHKIIGLLAINLALEKSSSGSTKWINNSGTPTIDPLFKLLTAYADAKGINKKGLGKSSFYEKLKISLSSVHDE